MPKLTEAQLQNETPGDKPRKLFDELGLFLLISPDGTMAWRVRYRFAGKEKLTQIGAYRKKGSQEIVIGLDAAREQRDVLRDLVLRGIDPTAHRKAQSTPAEGDPGQAGATASESPEPDGDRAFQEVAEAWMDAYAPTWSDKHARQNRQLMRDHVYPVVGAMPLRFLAPQDMANVLAPLVSAGKAESARRVRQRLAGVLEFGVLMGYLERHRVPLPMKLDPSFGCIAPAELPELVRAIDGYQEPVGQLALKLAMLTLARTADARSAKWEQFHELSGEAPLWRLPASRTGGHPAHEIPLSRQAVAVLDELRYFTGKGIYLFPDVDQPGRPVGESRLLQALWSLGYRGRMTAHGLRALGSAVLSEAGYPADLIAGALGANGAGTHGTGSRDQPEARRTMLQWYADRLQAAASEERGLE
ncbi:Prophage integrase IntA [Cupriavidus campinensis]|uniref:tyrosine-type recombinase/integrase n=1 Tax=Cupriavidus campinensis TaxID=151783 RepID=UPI001B0840CE|nr:integrase arm-type DNA-binding domain-containing protein [Cupriavidus campinensis]CAG2147274.1 Prophage integrase IntA [Cupriavidus campinensis]